jgi:hypothetical protein
VSEAELIDALAAHCGELRRRNRRGAMGEQELRDLEAAVLAYRAAYTAYMPHDPYIMLKQPTPEGTRLLNELRDRENDVWDIVRSGKKRDK